MSHKNEVSPQAIHANQLAEKQADAAAMQGKWETFAQPGFELSTGQIAVGAAQLYAPENLAEAHSAEVTNIAVVDATEPASDIAVVIDPHSRIPFTEKSGFTVRDSRRNTPESVEADFRDREADKKAMAAEQEEALRQPLDNAEISSAAKSLAAGILVREKTEGFGTQEEGKLKFPDGDMRALFRLDSMASGEVLGTFGEKGHQVVDLTVGERLDALVQNLATSRAVHDETRQVVFAGYHGANYYMFKRAKQVLDVLTADPKATREGLLDESSVISQELVDSIMQPMMVPKDEIIPDAQKIRENDRLVPLPTAYFGLDWVDKVHARERAAS